jgi:hypothetical protein
MMSLRRRIRPMTLEQLVDRIRREYVALPGLQLTDAQVQRLCQLDPAGSRRVLRHLIDAEFLACTEDGRYVRADVRPVRAALVGG